MGYRCVQVAEKDQVDKTPESKNQMLCVCA